MRRLTLLSGPAWPLPVAARRWLASEPAYVALEIVDPASPSARARWPSLPPAAASDDLAIVADDGRLWRGPRAWLVLLWALKRHRGRALRMARRESIGAARRFARALIHETPSPSAEGEARASRGPSPVLLLYAIGAIPWVVQVARLAPREPGTAAAIALVGLLLLPTRIGFLSASALLGTYLVAPELLGAAFLFAVFLGIPIWVIARAGRAANHRSRARTRRAAPRGTLGS